MRCRWQVTRTDVTFRLDEGRIHVLLGSSGSGKTTLLRVIAGVVVPAAGARISHQGGALREQSLSVMNLYFLGTGSLRGVRLQSL